MHPDRLRPSPSAPRRRRVTGSVLVPLVGVTVAASLTAGPAAATVASPTTGTTTATSTSDSVDVRKAVRVAPTATATAGLKSLLAASPSGTRAAWDSHLGTLRSLQPSAGYLTGPTSGSAVDVARGWLSTHAAAFDLTPAQVAGLVVQRDHALPGTGTHTVTFAQTYAGTAAAQSGRLNVAVTRDGRVLNYTGSPIRGTALAGAWSLGAGTALAREVARVAPGVTNFVPSVTGTLAGYTTFAAGPLAAPSYVKNAVFGTADGPRAAYRVYVVKSTDDAWEAVVDAVTGDELFRQSVVAHESEPGGTIYDNYPGAPKGGTPRQVSFGATKESPAGWVDPTGLLGTGITTLGNNANTYANWSNFLVPADQGPRPISPTGRFDYVYTNQWRATQGATVPPSYAADLNAAATNLFYQHNRIHDEYYDLGFTETAGNFQVNNNGKGGQGGDPILGLVQAGAATGGDPTYTGRDNAYMLTLDDGLPPWSGMFLWQPIAGAFEGPYADGSFDASVIQHEYTHGLSTRYVAGGSALTSQQAGSMGEGWSDWYALNHLYNAGLANTAVVGQYVTGNDARGIRNYDYDQNPTTFGDIGYDLTGAEVHADGEIWTAMLWDLRKALVAKYGAAAGAERAARIITDGMPLTAPAPSFLDARDGILTADLDRYHGEDTQLIWSVFAKRGAGLSASSVDGDDVDPKPAFDVPVTAANGTAPVTFVNATTGQPISGAKVVLGRYEARVTPLAVTSSTGSATITATPATYPLTVQAPGFGVQTIDTFVVTKGANKARTIKLAPNLASTAAGATIVSTSSEDTGSPAKFAFDDTASSVWATATGATSYNAGPDQRTTVKLAAPATVSSVRISAYKATNASRFAALKDFTVQTSTDGVTWTTARTGTFAAQAPRPVAPELNFATFTLAKPVKAAYVRFFADSTQGGTAQQAQVAEIEVFGAGATVGNGSVKTDQPFTDSGTIAGSNPAAGDPTGLQNVFGVTGSDFTNTCTAPPVTQGVDAWVTKLPAGFGDGLHAVTATGTSPADGTVGHDLDLYFLSGTCELVGSNATGATDESASIPPGTVYVLTQAYTGVNTAVTVKAVDTRA